MLIVEKQTLGQEASITVTGWKNKLYALKVYQEQESCDRETDDNYFKTLDKASFIKKHGQHECQLQLLLQTYLTHSKN